MKFDEIACRLLIHIYHPVTALAEIDYKGVYSLECDPLRDKEHPESWEENELKLINTAKKHVESVK